MANINMPRKKQPQDYLGLVGGVTGGVVGAVLGGPAGAAQGYSMGSGAGGMLGKVGDAATNRNAIDARLQSMSQQGATPGPQVSMPQKSDPLDSIQSGLGMGSSVMGLANDAKSLGSGSGGAANDPMSRRLGQIEQDPVTQLGQSKQALKMAPYDVQREYGPVIETAYEKALRERQRQTRGY